MSCVTAEEEINVLSLCFISWLIQYYMNPQSCPELEKRIFLEFYTLNLKIGIYNDVEPEW